MVADGGDTAYLPGRGRALLAVGALMLQGAASTTFFGAQLAEHLLMPDWETRAGTGDLGALVFALASGSSGFAAIVAALLTAVAFLVWLYRASHNAQVLGIRRPRTSPLGAVLCWFVPFLNLFRPYSVVRGLHWASKPATGRVRGDWIERMPSILPLWWGAWLVSSALSQVSFRMSMSDAAGVADESIWVDLVELPVSLVAATCAAAVIMSIQNRQDEQARLAEVFPGNAEALAVSGLGSEDPDDDQEGRGEFRIGRRP